LAKNIGELMLEKWRGVLETWNVSARCGALWAPRHLPSEIMSITSSPPTALSMKRALKRSCRGVEPAVLSKVAFSALSCSGVTVTDIAKVVL
jgi:hypothetical protein